MLQPWLCIKCNRHSTINGNLFPLLHTATAKCSIILQAKNATQLSNRNATIIKELNKVKSHDIKSWSLYKILQLVAQCMKLHYINRPSIESVTATLTKLNNGDNLNSSTTGRDNLVCVIIKLLPISMLHHHSWRHMLRIWKSV